MTLCWLSIGIQALSCHDKYSGFSYPNSHNNTKIIQSAHVYKSAISITPIVEEAQNIITTLLSETVCKNATFKVTGQFLMKHAAYTLWLE